MKTTIQFAWLIVVCIATTWVICKIVGEPFNSADLTFFIATFALYRTIKP